MGFWRRLVSCVALLSALVVATSPVHATAELRTLRERLVGTWLLVSATDVRKDGSIVNRWGENPKGTFIFTADGRYAQMILRTDFLFGAKNAASFGTYTVNEQDKIIVTRVEASSNHSYSGTERKRVILNITDDELTYVNPATSSGTSVRTVWKRAQ